jgi:hypothetical protein
MLGYVPSNTPLQVNRVCTLQREVDIQWMLGVHVDICIRVSELWE